MMLDSLSRPKLAFSHQILALDNTVDRQPGISA
jgi:hypothetical protein